MSDRDHMIQHLLQQALQIARGGESKADAYDSLGPPTAALRLEISGLAKQVTSMVMLDAARIQPLLDAAVEKAVREFDFERAVKSAVDAAIASYITRTADRALWTGNVVDGARIEKVAREAVAAAVLKEPR